MPTVLRDAGFRFFFFSLEGSEPPRGQGIHRPDIDEDVSVASLPKTS